MKKVIVFISIIFSSCTVSTPYIVYLNDGSILRVKNIVNCNKEAIKVLHKEWYKGWEYIPKSKYSTYEFTGK